MELNNAKLLLKTFDKFNYHFPTRDNQIFQYPTKLKLIPLSNQFLVDLSMTRTTPNIIPKTKILLKKKSQLDTLIDHLIQYYTEKLPNFTNNNQSIDIYNQSGLHFNSISVVKFSESYRCTIRETFCDCDCDPDDDDFCYCEINQLGFCMSEAPTLRECILNCFKLIHQYKKCHNCPKYHNNSWDLCQQCLFKEIAIETTPENMKFECFICSCQHINAHRITTQCCQKTLCRNCYYKVHPKCPFCRQQISQI